MTATAVRRTVRISAVAVAVVTSSALAACSGPSTSTPAQHATSAAGATQGGPRYSGTESTLPTSFGVPAPRAGTRFTVGWLNPNASIDALRKVQQGIQQEVDRLGGTLITLDAAANAQKEVSNFQQLLSQHVDAIVTYPVNPAGEGPLLQQARTQGVPVISIDTPPDADRPPLSGYTANVYIGRDQGAFAAASWVAAAYPKAVVATLGTSLPVPALAYMGQRAAYWSSRFELDYAGNVDAQGDSQRAAGAAMSALIARYPRVKVVYTYNDETAAAAAGAARASGRQDIVIVGCNGDSNGEQAFQHGLIANTIVLPDVEAGTQAVDGLYDVLTQQNLPLHPGINLVTKLMTG